MSEKNTRNTVVRRTLICLVTLLFLALTVWIISTVLSYFHTGAEWAVPQAYGKNTLLENAPDVVWENDVPTYGEKPDSFMRLEIETAYLKAWQALNYSFRTQNTDVIKDHFAETHWDQLAAMVKQQAGFQVTQADLSHHLNLTTFSLDKQLIAFTDKNVRIKKEIQQTEPESLLFDDLQEADFEVVMTLDDGKWHIRHFRRQVAAPASVLTSINMDSSIIEIKKKAFYDQEQLFEPAGVNYYPMETPWFDFWIKFDTSIVKQDFARIKDLHLNTIRIFVFYELFGAGNVKPEMLEKLDQLLELAYQYDLKVVVTLFDFLPSYEVQFYPSTEKQLKEILSRYKGHPAILAWDLKNEPDLDFERQGRQRVLSWLDYMIDRAHIYDPTHPVTIGWSAAEIATQLSRKVDFVSFHFYEPISRLPERLEELHLAISSKPIMVSEFGLPTYKSFPFRRGHTEEEQAAHYTTTLQKFQEHGPTSFISWTLYDFPKLPGAVFSGPFWRKTPQKHYGVIRTDGTLKPAGEVLSKWASAKD